MKDLTANHIFNTADIAFAISNLKSKVACGDVGIVNEILVHVKRPELLASLTWF